MKQTSNNQFKCSTCKHFGTYFGEKNPGSNECSRLKFEYCGFDLEFREENHAQADLDEPSEENGFYPRTFIYEPENFGCIFHETEKDANAIEGTENFNNEKK